MNIKILDRNQIDIAKWDKCIDDAKNGLIYAYSWYLDITAKKKWKAIVSDNYEFVMPFAEQSKYFIKYIYQPFFTQQLGVFSEKEITEDVVVMFLNFISKKYRFINANLNYANFTNNFNLQAKDNFELYLNKTYNELYKQYNKNAKTYYKKASKEDLSISFSDSPEKIIELKRNKPTINLNTENLNLLLKLLQKGKEKNVCKIYSLRNKNNELISAFYFMFSHKRAYYIFSESNEEGRKKFASFYLMNQFINDFAEKNITLDFEGSMIPGVARFFKSWGATNKPYYNFKQNKLPLFLRTLKK